MALTPLTKHEYVARSEPVRSADLNAMQDAIIELQNQVIIKGSQTLTSGEKTSVQTNLGIQLQAWDPGAPISDYVRIYKMGRLVVIMVTYGGDVVAPQAGWTEVGFGPLPEGYRPSRNTDFVLFDNNVSTSAANTIINCRISSAGIVSMYAFADKLSFRPRGTMVYIAAS